ncbi:hypothetical protein [Endozoicomonas sp. YOMI1]|uniref:hypothetical protein n=1 Tax=Endozoicomonas sp. YOMI1 TaxID=2828739 RepID=UPI0021497DE7|nr:hypothetical protein [Endozoicomonas sp. YOMI1]
MDGVSGAGSMSFPQEQFINNLSKHLADGHKVSVKFTDQGEFTIQVVKDVQSTSGLKLSDQQPDVSVPRKIPLQQRKAEVAAEKDTATVRKSVFKMLKSAKNYLQNKISSKFPKAAENLKKFDASVGAKIKNTFSDIKKAIKHENWEKIPGDSLKGGSDQLKLEAQMHNDSIDQLESLKNQEADRKTELDTLNQVYKNTRKVFEDSEGVIHSKKRITVPIPIEGADPVIIESSDPVARRGQVNKVLDKIKESGFAERINQLDSEIKQTRSEQKQLKASMKESGNRILELFKAEQHTLDQAEAKNTRLSKLQDDLSEKRINLESQVEQLQAEIRALKIEKQETKEYVAQQKENLSKFNKDLSLVGKFSANYDDAIPTSNEKIISCIKDAQEMIEIGSARLKAIPGEMKEKKAELDTKMKEIDNLQKGKELKKHEKADKGEIAAEQNKLKQQLGKNLRKK